MQLDIRLAMLLIVLVPATAREGSKNIAMHVVLNSLITQYHAYQKCTESP